MIRRLSIPLILVAMITLVPMGDAQTPGVTLRATDPAVTVDHDADGAIVAETHVFLDTEYLTWGWS
ncbi:MAG: hypothetical protein KDC38_17505, partial [Planctomycetes bacterium]|nr:hypothetical protein [Planctomycetota bacterium]